MPCHLQFHARVACRAWVGLCTGHAFLSHCALNVIWLGGGWACSSACTHALSFGTSQAAGYKHALRRCPALCALGLTMTASDFFFPVVKAQMNQQGCTLQHLQLCLALDLYTLMEHRVVGRCLASCTAHVHLL